MSTTSVASSGDTKARPGAAASMDRMYRYTRHIYDLTRKPYLLGRDRLLSVMDIQPSDRVLEIGCGTARNLIKLHQLHPHAELFGLDAASVMLETAQANLRRAGMGDQVTLRQALAEELDHGRTFGLDRPFDAIFFSYALSMIPTWPAAVEAAMANLKPGGGLYVVDFWDQRELPGAFAKLLTWWLAKFHVHFRPEMLEYLRTMAGAGRVTLELESVAGRYAYVARMRKVG
ncbi:MAG: class I SAM-dependent methyltransferase [Phycisphaeraceae bacterium]|nr:class I SAM-dependent methyltransferase [Phycisphaeraceae bacterium]